MTCKYIKDHISNFTSNNRRNDEGEQAGCVKKFYIRDAFKEKLMISKTTDKTSHY